MKMRHKGLFSLLGLALVAGMGSAVAVSSNAVWQEVQAAQTTATKTSFSTGETSGTIDDKISFNAYKGGAGNAPGVYSGALRLYQGTTNTSGGYIVIKAADNYLLDSVAVTTGQKTNVNHYIGDYYTVSTDTGIPLSSCVNSSSTEVSKDGSYTASSLSSSAVSIACFGTTSSNRLNITAIEVKYSPHTSVTSVTVGGTPTKATQYTGIAFDYSGLTFTGDDGTVIQGSEIVWNDLVADQNPTGDYLGVPVTVTSVTVVENAVNALTIEGSMTKKTYLTVDSWDPAGLTVSAAMLSGDSLDVTESVVWSYSPEKPNDATITSVVATATYTYAGVQTSKSTDPIAVKVVTATLANVTDTLTGATTGVSGGSYASWSGKTAGDSGAVYAGTTAGTNDTIQMNGSPRGVVSTKSGGTLVSVTVAWNSETSSERSVTIYGSNTAYTSAADLHDETTQGTSLGTIVCGTSTSLTIDGSYAYIGIASSQAVYLDSISIVWNSYVYAETGVSVKTNPTKLSYNSGDAFAPAGLVLTVTYGDDSTRDVAYDDYPDLFTFGTSTMSAGVVSVNGTYKQYSQTGIAFTIDGITVADKTIQRIAVTTQPTKSSYVMGEKIDYTDIVVTGYYSDTSEAPIDASDLVFSRAAGDYVTAADAEAGSIAVTISLNSVSGITTTLNLTVTEATAFFTKVTDISELEIGATYTFAYAISDNELKAASPMAAETSFFAATDAIYTDGSVFVDSDSVADFTLAPGSASGKYALWSDVDKGYIYQDSSESTVHVESSFANGDLTISFDEDGTVNVLDSDRYIGYNAGNPRFTFYKDTAQYPVNLYKRYLPSNTAYGTADSWANNFLNVTESACNGGTIETEWDTILTDYAVPTDVLAKDFLVRGTANADTGANLIDQALARYDYIVNKYATLDDPLERRASSASPAWHIDDLGDNATLIVIASAFSFSILLGGAILLRRRFKGTR